MIKHKKSLSYALMVFVLALLFSHCKNDEEQQYQGLIPNVHVSFYIYPNNEGLIPGMHRVYPQDGYKGVLVYCLEQNTYLAYEMACPYDFQKDSAIVEFDPTTLHLVDSVCGSRFQIIDGMPVGGPASVPLKQYFTDYDFTTGLLHVYNSN